MDSVVAGAQARINRGYAIPPYPSYVSGASGLSRVAAVKASVSSYELASRPRGILDQNGQPCCVSCALTAAVEALNPSVTALAPAFHYFVTRFDEGGADLQGELYLDDALRAVSKLGICRKTIHSAPLTAQGLTTRPSELAYEDGKVRALRRTGLRERHARSGGFSKVAWIRDQLRLERPVIIGFQLPATYPDSFLNRKKEWLHPEQHPVTASGHCVLVTGYNDLRQCLHIQDSQGGERFEGGSWWMGYRVADSPLVHQARCLIP